MAATSPADLVGPAGVIGKHIGGGPTWAGAETFGRLRARVAAELTTTFASRYTREVSLAGMLNPDAFNEYVKRATGEKFLVTPHALS